MVAIDRLIIDIVTLVLGIVGLVIITRTKLSENQTIGFTFFIIGFIILDINHLLDTLVLAEALGPQVAPLVHRINNLIGFIFMILGIIQLSKTLQKSK